MSDRFDEAISYLIDRIRVANENNLATPNGSMVLAEARLEFDANVAQLWRKLDGIDNEATIRNLIGDLLTAAFYIGHYGPVSDSSWATAKKWRDEEVAAKARAGKRKPEKSAAIEKAIAKHVPENWDGQHVTSIGDAVSDEVERSGFSFHPKTARTELQNRYGLPKRVRAVGSRPKKISGG